MQKRTETALQDVTKFQCYSSQQEATELLAWTARLEWKTIS
jgi:hypothetical protein